jgi:arylsulfatase
VVKTLPGRDFSALLTDPENASTTAVRPAVLFNYVGPGTVDAAFLSKCMECLLSDKSTPALSEADLSKRGFLSLVFDGRYKFGRYYAPTAPNRPRTLAELQQNNDVQLFDLQHDPGEIHNLALEPKQNEATILKMNALLNEMIEKEIGVDGDRLLERALHSTA